MVGFTSGIRTFTTAPLVFTSYKNAQDYTGLPADQTMFILVKAARRGARNSAAHWPASRTLTSTRRPSSARTPNYWMFGTGAGITVLIAAISA